MSALSRWSGEVVGDNIVWTEVPGHGTLSFWSDTAGPVRPTDPETSVAAAAIPGRNTQRWRVLEALAAGPSHDEGLAHALHMEKGSASKRRGELVEAGWAEWTGDHTRTSTGASSRVWRLTDAGRQMLKENE